MARTEQTGKRIGRNVLLVCDRLHEASSPGRAARALQEDLTAHELSPVIALSTAAAHEAIEADPHLQALLLDWDLHQDPSHTQAREVLDALRARNAKLPVFLLATREAAPTSRPR
ncbi:hypothetical protein GT370_15715 [Acidocella sp. MX-AZ03]|uniref:Orn/Lys/Arg decarboxylase N-terminal domain-containing protein n=1 Tax=Acidocella sp. MX-AZ03 TaxID=2697363 RepID=UPI0022DDE49E|nr:Orn/Lys/Arg decarboxylase N-terminal domain-containing protein [Acidocella sp. MX-AZ03]WBO58592.1 hypothetical protein GT370_15715 [Acidocella sp. MX-AZ03]